MGNINGQPNRIPSSSSLLMKKRDKKQRKEGNTSHTYNDIDGIGQIASEENFRYHISDGFVARLEAIYGKDIMQDSFLDDKKRTKIVAEDWSELAEGPCLGDCCGDECDEVSSSSDHIKFPFILSSSSLIIPFFFLYLMTAM